MKISELNLTEEEARLIRERFESIPSWGDMKTQFPEFKENIDNLPDTSKFVKVIILTDLFIETVCDIRNIGNNGSIV